MLLERLTLAWIYIQQKMVQEYAQNIHKNEIF